MRYLAALPVLCALSVHAQKLTDAVSCFHTIGPVSYPAYHWGSEEEQGVNATIRVQSDGKAAILSLDQTPPPWADPFAIEVQKSIAASTFESKCSGETITVYYQFEATATATIERATALTPKPPNLIRVIAGRPGNICDQGATNKDEAEAARGRSDWLVDNKQFEQALKCAEVAVAWKATADAYVTKGVALRKLNRPREAVLAYDKAEKLEPTNRYVHFDRASSYRDLGELDRAIQDYTTGIRLNPSSHQAYLNRGNVYLRLQRLDRALADYSSAIDLHPRNPKAYTNRCLVRNDLGNHDEALKDCTKAIEMDSSDPAIFNNRANVFIALQRFDDALKDTDSAVALDPNFFEARLLRGVTYAYMKRFETAEAELTAAIRLMPDSADAFTWRARVRYLLGDLEGYESDQEQAERFKRAGPVKAYTRDAVTGRSIPIR